MLPPQVTHIVTCKVMRYSRPNSRADLSTSLPTRYDASSRASVTQTRWMANITCGRSVADTRVCNAQAIHVVDPQTLQIQKNITVDQTGAPLTNAQNKSRTWNDVAFVEVSTHTPCLHAKLALFTPPLSRATPYSEHLCHRSCLRCPREVSG